MIMNWRKAYLKVFRLALYITAKGLHVKNTGYFSACDLIMSVPIRGAVPRT